jgi:hypothetical protein
MLRDVRLSMHGPVFMMQALTCLAAGCCGKLMHGSIEGMQCVPVSS